MIRMGAKNPNFSRDPNVPGGGGDDDGKKNASHKVLIICLVVTALVLATFGLLYFFIRRNK